jgi:FlaA1/EpsC-like NDP-sugar epimerase
MGEQIKVVDIARNLIRLAGFVPEVDIPVTFIGLRPGEKLYEELVGVAEGADPTGVDKILRIRRHAPPELSELQPLVRRLLMVATQGDADAAILALHEVVPTFAPAPAAGRVCCRDAT